MPLNRPIQLSLAIFTAAIVLLPSMSASAFRGDPHGSTTLELHSGAAVRAHLRTAWRAPDAHAAWGRFTAQHDDARWQVLWNLDTRSPQRIFGRGIAAPGSITSPEAAERAARSVLARSIELLAPGAKVDDFVLVSNVLEAGVRSVGFEQRFAGMPVLGGQVSFRFKKDRLIAIGSEARPDARVADSTVRIDDATARSTAEQWILRDRAEQARGSAVQGPLILPAFLESGEVLYHRVLEVRVDAQAPIGRWSVYLDAATGRPIARRQTLLFASGTIAMDIPERRPGGTRLERAASRLSVSVDGQAAETAADGTVSWTGTAPAQVSASVIGPMVSVINDAGARVTTTFSLADAGRSVWSEAGDEQKDAQLITFISAYLGKEYVRQISPGFAFLDDQLEATVNLGDTCNAYSDGTTINFFRSGGGCENTGRLPDVIYHEFGHSVHANAIIRGVGSFDTSLSEGASDYLAATMVNDPGMGRGFFFNDRELRHIDPTGSEATWPRDQDQDPHITGLIFAGAMWDVRKALIAAHGPDQGVALTDKIWFDTLRRAADIPSSYTEVLVADDDDGDLSNGTPHVCQINAAFAAHGLAEADQVGPSIGHVEVSGFEVLLPVGQTSLCPGAEVGSARLIWELRGQAGTGGTIPMTLDGDRFRGSIPPQPAGAVVRYRIELALASGDVTSLPNNPADPMYEMFIGPVTPIYCTDFESDPTGAGGWTHRLVSGSAREGADDWQWGQPDGTVGSGDPGAAHSGQMVMGNDLGGGNFNGLYQSGKVNELASPSIDVSGYSNVRLQYWRWLNVEDGFFDKAQITANGEVVWSNLATDAQGSTHHTDHEWRFQDVDLSAQAATGAVQVAFRIGSDAGLEFGGWTIDDFCVVSYGGATAVCGNGVLDSGEQCDDGNTIAGDGCEPTCVPSAGAICGDGVVQAGEQCDDGNGNAGDGCKPDCTADGSLCGDGVIQTGEQCDDGNTIEGDGCSARCTAPGAGGTCGDGVVDANEECDPGAAGADACTADCHRVAGSLNEAAGGCGCSTTPNRGSSLAVIGLLVGLALLGRRRRR